MMSKGVLFFALNNSKVDYTKLAVFAASRVKKFLNVPVTVVTDSKSLLLQNDINHIIDTVLEIEDNSINLKRFYNGSDDYITLPWKNGTRYTSFDISPYDETLVLDVDYIVNSEILSYCWDNPHEFLIYKEGFDLSGSEYVKYASEYSIPFYWATAFYFKKTDRVKSFFDLILHMKDNWEYYRFVYNIPDLKFRNDHAFSMAIHIMNGFTDCGFVNYLPSKLYYASDNCSILEMNDTTTKLLLENSSNYIPLKTTGLDLHLMNKFSLLEWVTNE